MVTGGLIEDQKQRQVEYHELEHYRDGRPREADNSNPLIASLNSYRMRKLLEMIGTSLHGKSVLSVCGGDGDEADFLQRQGALVTMTDLSTVGVRTARVRNPALQCIEMDSEMLAFADRSFDWAIVRDGLHHLARPLKGLYELERVSREGFAIVEGQDSCVVRLLVKLGLGENWDPAGGYVYRFTRRELQKVFNSIQTVSDWQIYTAWLPPGSDAIKHFSVAMDLAHPVLNQPLIYPVLCSRTGRAAFKMLFNGANLLAGRWGNSLIVVAWKKATPLDC
jgi:ubiquinone/menaquinone biosynthesis C-methylase UbiE